MWRAAAGYVLAVAVAAAACRNDGGLSACFEPDAVAYPASLPGDSAAFFSWPASYQPVRVYAEPPASFQAHVDSGLRLWVAGFRCGELNARLVSDSTTADIVVRNPTSLPPPQALSLHVDSTNACRGRTDLFVDSTNVVLRPIRVFLAPASVDSALIRSCYRFVTAHEIGHALGLFRHSPNPEDLMYSVPRRRLLSPSDRYTIELLYHAPPTLRPAGR